MTGELTRRDVLLVGGGAAIVGSGALILSSDSAAAVDSSDFDAVSSTFSDNEESLVDILLSDSSYLELSWSGFDTGDELTVDVYISAHDDGDPGTNTQFDDTDPAYDPELLLAGTITLDSAGGDSERFYFDTDIDWTTGSAPQSIVYDGDGAGGHSSLSLSEHFEPDDDDYVSAEDHYERVTHLECDVDLDSTALSDPVEAHDPYTVTVQYDELDTEIRGTVTHESDPVEGAVVIVVDSDDNIVAGTGETNADGEYAIDVDSGEHHVMVQYEDEGAGIQRTDDSKPFVTV